MIDKILRYGIVARRLGPDPQGRILDVGAGPQGLGAVLPHKFVGVDPWYPEPPVPSQTAIKASGTALPFTDQSFEHVLCIEVLEHVPPEFRAPMVAEMCRVARRQVIITHPYGRLSRAADWLMLGMYKVLRAMRWKDLPWWLVEHLQTAYPEPNLYLPRDARFRVLQSGQENVVLHIPLALFGNIRQLVRWAAGVERRRPGTLHRLLRLCDFPPYCRRVVILERLDR